VSNLANVHAIIPLALLEAIRNLDTPLNDGLPAELADETFTKRLGLSSTVAQQIERYRDMAEKHVRIGEAEVVQVFRLVGRRQDATLVYADAGRRAARYGARTRGGMPSAIWRIFPGGPQRRAGIRAAARVLRRIFDLTLTTGPGPISLRLSESLATRAEFAGNGCYFYSSLVAELLRVTSGFEGSMIHERCRGRGDDGCLWRAADADSQW